MKTKPMESIIVYDKEGTVVTQDRWDALESSHPVASPQGMETYLRETFPTAALARLEVDNHRAVLTVVYEKPNVMKGVWGLDGVEQFPPGGNR